MEEVKEIIEEHQEEIGDDLQRTARGRISYTTQGTSAVFTNPFGDSHMARTRITFPRHLVSMLKDPLHGRHIKHHGIPKGPGYQKAAKNHRLLELEVAYKALLHEVETGYRDDLRCVVLANQMMDNWVLSGWHPSLMVKVFDLESFKFGVLIQPPLDKRSLASKLKRDFQATMFDHMQLALIWAFFLEFKGTGPQKAIHSCVSLLLNDIMMLDYISHTHDEQVEDFILSSEGVQVIESMATRIAEFLSDGNDNPEAYFSSVSCDVPYPKPWRKALMLRILYFWDSFNEANPVSFGTYPDTYAKNEIYKMEIAAHYRRRMWQRLRCGSFAGTFAQLEPAEDVVKAFEQLTEGFEGILVPTLQKIAKLMLIEWEDTEARKESTSDHLSARLRFTPDLIGNRFVFEFLVKEGRISIAAPQNQGTWLAEEEFYGGSKAQRKAFAKERSEKEKEKSIFFTADERAKIKALMRATTKASVESKEKEMVPGLSPEEKKTVEMFDISTEDQKNVLRETKINKEMDAIILGYMKERGIREVSKEEHEKLQKEHPKAGGVPLRAMVKDALKTKWGARHEEILKDLVKRSSAKEGWDDRHEDILKELVKKSKAPEDLPVGSELEDINAKFDKEKGTKWGERHEHILEDLVKKSKEGEGEEDVMVPAHWGPRDTAIFKALIKKTKADPKWVPDEGSNYERVRDKWVRETDYEAELKNTEEILEGYVKKRKYALEHQGGRKGHMEVKEGETVLESKSPFFGMERGEDWKDSEEEEEGDENESDLEKEARSGGERYKEHFKEATGEICAIREDCGSEGEESDASMGSLHFDFLDERELQMEAFAEERKLERKTMLAELNDITEVEGKITYSDVDGTISDLPMDFNDEPPFEKTVVAKKRGRPPRSEETKRTTRRTAYLALKEQNAHYEKVLSERYGHEYTGPKYGKKK